MQVRDGRDTGISDRSWIPFVPFQGPTSEKVSFLLETGQKGADRQPQAATFAHWHAFSPVGNAEIPAVLQVPNTAGIAQFPARENSRKRDAMTTPSPCLFLNHARVQENEAFSGTNRGKR